MKGIEKNKIQGQVEKAVKRDKGNKRTVKEVQKE
jgi:hypothetical protein